MEPRVEIRRLLDVIPASSRMTTKIVSKPEQVRVIDAVFPLPWNRERPIYINFDLWLRLAKPQRDLLLLQKVSWLTGVRWFKPDIYQGVVLAGLLAGLLESAEADVVGVAVAGGLSAIALVRIWQTHKSSQSELNADLAALQIAQRRGYSETEAAQHLLSAIEAIALIENYTLSFSELIRCQNLRAIAGLSSVGIPKGY
ncbi:DUF3318 domain-containing protein [Nodularia sphaerocarpa]|uniref:DUF3318 domain-containing protein n=1 Tax=Nodularia sphaerocarpa TaxID=137816 RepID=UPI001EFBC8E2|nr:DUF3318 domain-containing protein [Nodularia sphaerocarpa]MDB9374473.1 DUF3318 domain-containing protein [Nodularia sphaerocarpa CS-585]MDB9378717.1 DUF3318 domain-containing protein [Nodularia sphaerocarpa CS-585A2]ULP72545.1 hypothetical protein BDGGKGIB_02189 [Nodularia sphaerocarpa UHCC 0038]